MLRVARFLLSYMRHPTPGVTEEEVSFPAGGEETPATLLRPAGGGRHPGWIVLHGITVPGRHHPVLLRFAHALAATGGAVLLPEIRPWKELRVDPAIADATISGAARYLADHPAVAGREVALVGFSFGATQALVTAARPELRDVLRTVVGFGGYCDLGRTLRFMMLGRHEWRGVEHRLDPDPYGRWIVAGNYLTAVPEFADMQPVAEAALELAAEAGRRFVYAGDTEYDPIKAHLRERLRPREREVWDLIAPPTHVRPPEEPTRAVADRLVEAALRTHPALDPRPALRDIDRRVVLAHGYLDHLVPFTESLRLQEHLGERADVSVTITRLFAHSRGAEGVRLREYPLEAYRYLRLLARALQR